MNIQHLMDFFKGCRIFFFWGGGQKELRHPDVGMVVILLQEFLCWGRRHIFLKQSHGAIFQKYSLFEFIEFRTCCCFLILDPSCGDDPFQLAHICQIG